MAIQSLREEVSHLGRQLERAQVEVADLNGYVAELERDRRELRALKREATPRAV